MGHPLNQALPNRPVCKFDRKEAARRFLQGETLSKIGRDFGVSGEAVRQALYKLGISGQHGGRQLIRLRQAKSRKAAEQARSTRRVDFLKTAYGLTVEEYESTRSSPKGAESLRAYAAQRKAVLRAATGQAGDEWQLTYKQWWSTWETSGVWHRRARGGFGLARVRKNRPFRKGNVAVVWQPSRFREGTVPSSAIATAGRCVDAETP